MFKPDKVLIEGLKARYGEAQRAYHTWDHIEALLGHFETLSDHIADKTRIIWALYWHDAIYDPTRSDNETASADLLRTEAKGHIPDTMLEEAAIAKGEPDAVAAPFSLDRFSEGRMIDESVAAAVAH